ncbi:J domain-containing protein [Paenibacillus dakarensis]|uniref:J domain-containing protein n=1 Tax=Paenibacillus dakarensis TaxID=1527293 RepID=UPI0006D58D6D|nr:J domain-containing protein [Paenibacillus dakarensis]
MSIWSTLGIEPTEDSSAIKKAYARKLRQHHPEEDPEGYQRLREAYDRALKYAKMMAEHKVQEAYISQLDDEDLNEEAGATEALDEYAGESEDDFRSIPEAHEKHRAEVDDALSRTERGSAQTISEFMQQLDELYSDFEARIDLVAWETLLNSDVVWNVELSGQLQDAMLYYLEDHPHLPHDIWERLDTSFHWSRDPEERDEELQYHDWDFIRWQLDGSLTLGYDCFKNSSLPDNFDYETYLELRCDAQSELMNGNRELAYKYLEEAHGMFAADPDLELMRGKWFLEADRTDEALACFTTVLDLRSDDRDARWLRAGILFERQQYEEAIQDGELLLARSPEDNDILCFIGRCHIELDHNREAIVKYMQKSNELDKSHMPTLIYWAESGSREAAKNVTMPADKKRKLLLNNLLFLFFLTMRLSWLYIFVYLGLQLFFDVHPIYLGLLVIVILWNAWKTFRISRLLGT